MSKEMEARKGFLANAFKKPCWDSRIKSANTTKKEMWLGYVIGVWGMMMTNSIVNSYYNQYLTDVLGFTADKALWIPAFMVVFPVLSKLLDAITNLVMSKIIDSTVSRQGKVRPWILISVPFVFLSVVLMFCMPFQNVKAQAIWVVVMFNLYYSVSYTMWNMSKELMPAVSTRNVNQRKNLSMAATIVGNVGTGVVSILFPTLLTAVVAMCNGNNARGYFYCMSMVACVAVPTALVQYFYTRERVTEERRNQVGVTDADVKEEIKVEAGLLEQAKACLKDKYWRIFILVFFIFNLMGNLRNIALVYYSGWVVHGNAYGEYAAIQAKFQMIAFSPMGPGILLLLPLMKKWGRTKCIWVGGTLTVVGSVMAFLNAGNGTMIYAGSALAGIGNIPFSYVMASFLGDVIDHVEWKTKVRCDGLSGGFSSAAMMFAVGIAQGIFNLGLMMSGYAQPNQIGTSPEGIALYADQLPSVTKWINFAYQGSYIIVGLVVFIVFCFLFDIEKKMPQVAKELQERKVEECRARGIEYIPAEELERREIEEQERIAEENRIRELRERCEKKGKDFEKENQKVLDKRAAKAARSAAKAANREKKK